MYAASRAALGEARVALTEAVDSVAAGERTAASAQAGADLFAVVGVLDDQRTLRSALADSSTSSQARSELAGNVFGGKVGEPAVAALRTASGQDWSSARDLTNSLVRLGRESLLRAAQDQGQIDTVEDELFRLGRIVAGNPELEQALSDRTKPQSASRDLLSKLLYGKVTAVTEALATQAIGRLRESPAAALESLSAIAAELKNEAVAHVRSSTPLSDEQISRLSATLERIYGKPVTVHVEVDPELLSGLVVRVGDEVIDGSGAGRLAALRRSLA